MRSLVPVRTTALLGAAVAIVLTALVSAVLMPQHSSAAPSKKVLVFGDSITAQYTDDPGDPMQGWWSIAARQHGWDVETSAQGGGGLVKKGATCYGTAIRERSGSVLERVRPDVVFVVAGVNDRSVCVGGKVKTASATFRANAIKGALDKLGREATAAGAEKVIVSVPWGIDAPTVRSPVVNEYITAVKAYNTAHPDGVPMTFVNARRFTKDQLRDKTHPRLEGSQYLAALLGPRA